MVIKTVAALSTCLTKGFSAIYVCWWSCLSAPCPISPRPLHPIFKFCYVYAVVKKSIIPYKCRNHGSVSQLSLHYQMTKNCLQSKTVHVVWPVPILNCTISKKNHAHTSQQFDDCHIFPTPFTPSGIIKRGSPVLCLVLQWLLSSPC